MGLQQCAHLALLAVACGVVGGCCAGLLLVLMLVARSQWTGCLVRRTVSPVKVGLVVEGFLQQAFRTAIRVVLAAAGVLFMDAQWR